MITGERVAAGGVDARRWMCPALPSGVWPDWKPQELDQMAKKKAEH